MTPDAPDPTADFTLDQVLAQIPERVALVGRDYRYVFCSEANAAFHGRTAASLVGASLADVIGPARFAARARDNIDRCLRGGQVDYDDIQTDRQGVARIFAINARPFRDEDGAIIGALITSRDVTDERRAFDSLAEARRSVERARAARGAMLANVTAGMTALLAEAVAEIEAMERDPLDARVRAFVDMLVRSGREMDNAMRQLGAIAEIEAGRVRPARRSIAPRALARRAVARFHAESGAPVGGVAIDCAPGADATRRGDPARIGDVLRNLLIEAARAAPAAALRLRITADGTRLRFDISATPVPDPVVLQLGSAPEGLELALSRELALVLGGAIVREGRAAMSFEVHAPRT